MLCIMYAEYDKIIQTEFVPLYSGKPPYSKVTTNYVIL